MEPHFHAGDLVLVRQQSDYRVGQIVAYRNKQLDTTVLHRIVGRTGSRYVFKGDNNNFQDFEHPTRSQLLGAMWIHVPGAGAELASIRSPALIGGLFALGMLLIGGAAFTKRRRRRRRERRNEQRVPSPLTAPSWPAPGLLAFGLAAILPFVALALLAFTRPTAANVYDERRRTSSGARSPTRRARRRGRPTRTGALRTGDPLFTHVVRTVDFAFSYRFVSPARQPRHRARRAQRDGRVDQRLDDDSAAGQSSDSPPRRRPARGHARPGLAAEIGLSRRGDHGGARLLHGHDRAQDRRNRRVGGSPLHATFSPETKFSLNALEMRPVTSSGAASEARTTVGSFSHRTAGTVTVRRSQPAHLSLVLVTVPVATARAVALVGIAAVLCALLAASALARTGSREETTRILSRYGSMIVPVAQIWQQPGVAVIDVADFDSLLKIAAHYERSILHEHADYGDAFWVTDESGQFRYAIWASTARRPRPPTARSRSRGSWQRTSAPSAGRHDRVRRGVPGDAGTAGLLAAGRLAAGVADRRHGTRTGRLDAERARRRRLHDRPLVGVGPQQRGRRGSS